MIIAEGPCSPGAGSSCDLSDTYAHKHNVPTNTLIGAYIDEDGLGKSSTLSNRIAWEAAFDPD
jgi:hypothetical protein